MTAESQPIQPAEVGDLPTINDDELLYSIVARYGWTTGYLDATSANLDLFGRAFGHAASRMPSNLDAMARRLPASLGLTGRDLALNHTLLPYHCAFLPAAAKERAIAKAVADSGRRGRRVGGFKKPLPPPTRLRFCPECLAGTISGDRDPYWKRVHQLPIVVICPDHGCDLRESSVSPGPADRMLHPASAQVCGPERPSVVPHDVPVDRDALLRLARHARTLLQGDYPAGITRESGPRYALLLRDLGHARGRQLDWERIVPDLPSAIAGVVPALPQVASIGSGAMGWFATAMATNRPRHADRVLIAAMVVEQIEGLARRFWTVLDETTGEPLMRLPDAA